MIKVLVTVKNIPSGAVKVSSYLYNPEDDRSDGTISGYVTFFNCGSIVEKPCRIFMKTSKPISEFSEPTFGTGQRYRKHLKLFKFNNLSNIKSRILSNVIFLLSHGRKSFSQTIFSPFRIEIVNC